MLLSLSGGDGGGSVRTSGGRVAGKGDGGFGSKRGQLEGGAGIEMIFLCQQVEILELQAFLHHVNSALVDRSGGGGRRHRSTGRHKQVRMHQFERGPCLGKGADGSTYGEGMCGEAEGLQSEGEDGGGGLSRDISCDWGCNE